MFQQPRNDELQQEVQQKREGNDHSGIQGKLDGQHKRLPGLERAHHLEGPPPRSVCQHGSFGIQGFRQIPHGRGGAAFPDENLLPVLRQRLRAAKNQGSLRQICLGRGNLAEKQCPLGSSQARHGRCHFLGLTPGIQTNPCRKMGFFKHIPHLVDGTPQDVHQIGRKPGAQNCADGQAQSHPQQHGPQVVQMLQKGLFLIFPFNLPLLPQTEYVF